MENKRQIGAERENRACDYIKNQGVIVKERNFRSRFGEIDIIGVDGDTLVFFEVKYRKKYTSGTAEEAVNFSKQKIICAVADFYRMKNHIDGFTLMRYDVIAMDEENISWIKNAFQHIYNKQKRRR